MLYDLFICHASEDKDSFVRPLAEALQKENVEVWYDEFSLKLGDSIRRSIDKGLSQSRFGVVVLSQVFFSKQWTQYELDGLVEREIAGKSNIILLIWHEIEYKTVVLHSPSLANRKAVITNKGLDNSIKEILKVIHPQGSPLIVARDLVLEWGLNSPVITDAFWLNVIEASNRSPAYGVIVPENAIWGRWSFPLPDKEGSPDQWGEKLAWTAMQMNWVKSAETIPISPLTPPEIVHEFIQSHPGLYETCLSFPSQTAEYVPQLTIHGFKGPFKEVFEKEYNESIEKSAKTAASSPISGTG